MAVVFVRTQCYTCNASCCTNVNPPQYATGLAQAHGTRSTDCGREVENTNTLPYFGIGARDQKIGFVPTRRDFESYYSVRYHPGDTIILPDDEIVPPGFGYTYEDLYEFANDRFPTPAICAVCSCICKKVSPSSKIYCEPFSSCSACGKADYICEMYQCTKREAKPEPVKVNTNSKDWECFHFGKYYTNDCPYGCLDEEDDDFEDHHEDMPHQEDDLFIPDICFSDSEDYEPIVSAPPSKSLKRRHRQKVLRRKAVELKVSKVVPPFVPAHVVQDHDSNSMEPAKPVVLAQDPKGLERRQLRLSTGFIAQVGAIPKSHELNDFFLSDALHLQRLLAHR